MKLAFAFAAAMAATTSAFAADLPVPGLSLDTEIKLNHAYDAEATTLTINPELAWEPIIDGPWTLTAGTTITAFDSTTTGGFTDDFVLLDALDAGNRPELELGATMQVRENLEVFAETGWDFNAKERTEIEFGVAFNF